MRPLNTGLHPSPRGQFWPQVPFSALVPSRSYRHRTFQHLCVSVQSPGTFPHPPGAYRCRCSPVVFSCSSPPRLVRVRPSPALRPPLRRPRKRLQSSPFPTDSRNRSRRTSRDGAGNGPHFGCTAPRRSSPTARRCTNSRGVCVTWPEALRTVRTMRSRSARCRSTSPTLPSSISCAAETSHWATRWPPTSRTCNCSRRSRWSTC